jgi:copper chaperone CopZ
MKKLYPIALSAALLAASTGCFRHEVQVAEYSVPEMATPAAGAYLQNQLKGVPGIVASSFDLEDRTFTVDYQSSTIRTMNIEEAIAIAGFTVNGRPANPNAKLPEGLK